MTVFERLEQAAYDNHINLVFAPLPEPLNGLFFKTMDFCTITISTRLQRTCEHCVVLAEELGHYHTILSDLFHASPEMQEYYERKAFEWMISEVIPLPRIVDSWKAGIRTAWETAEYLDMPEEVLMRALEFYEKKYGACVKCGNYCIHFRPVEVKEA